MKYRKQEKTIPCPECQYPLPVTIETLLNQEPISCPNTECEVVLNLNTNNSYSALNEIKRLDTAMQKFEKEKASFQ